MAGRGLIANQRQSIPFYRDVRIIAILLQIAFVILIGLLFWWLLRNMLNGLRAAGLPVDSLDPEGAIYLSARLNLIGRAFEGRRFASSDDIRRFVLEQAGFAVVPFDAFGYHGESGWVRLSVGAVSMRDIEGGLQRLRAALERVT